MVDRAGRTLRDRLRRVRPDVEVVGIEIDPARVAAACAELGEVMPKDGYMTAPAVVRSWTFSSPR